MPGVFEEKQGGSVTRAERARGQGGGDGLSATQQGEKDSLGNRALTRRGSERGQRNPCAGHRWEVLPPDCSLSLEPSSSMAPLIRSSKQPVTWRG